jgi:hypothetical protein
MLGLQDVILYNMLRTQSLDSPPQLYLVMVQPPQGSASTVYLRYQSGLIEKVAFEKDFLVYFHC